MGKLPAKPARADVAAILAAARQGLLAQAAAMQVWIDLHEPTIPATTGLEAHGLAEAFAGLIEAFLSLAGTEGMVQLSAEARKSKTLVRLETSGSAPDAPRELTAGLCRALARLWSMGAATELSLDTGRGAACTVTLP